MGHDSRNYNATALTCTLKGVLDRFAGSNLSGTSTANYAELQRMVLDKETIRGVIVRTDWRSGVVEQSISLWRKK